MKKVILQEVVEKYGLTSIQEELQLLTEDRLDIKVAFLGEFSSGKSSLVNA
ncbi:GTP-binding protein HSR1-related protein [Nitritalea halalkaliphila LW7]|uniref:GTP-binding protein HSR1-related protein n=1 Tax=Nitritalea halalkaliphila LW7 TaxID=1189621 RepID=I5BYC8_9BACT|nr:GTP-binding protein HSR1-related protein [Nitritalea halalkaliphila]EIM74580.1 GTP-binding protein HSR1-related protein [Nitritalea halalkaliphila LW7]